ncbi:MAG TPA: MmgE/PrpD family protein [Dehalococcoidia bacterium]|nr:MmgE/PrpD family protein [Dehalococcoidia bacterium]
MDSSFEFAENIVNIRYSDLPAEVVEITKRCILDTLGVMLAASSLAPDVKEIVEMVKEGGGKEESTIIAFGGRVTAWMAAFANGTMGHPLDYDDTHDPAIVHPTAHTIPAAFAIAERIGGVNGEDFITAVALANDMVCRLGLALNKGLFGYGWLRPVVLGFFSSTAAAGKLLGLNRDQMVNAFGLVLNQVAGSLEPVHTPGSAFRAIRDAFSAKAGVLSALMAERGVPGDRNSLQGKYGLFNLYFQGDYDPTRLTAELGKRFEGVNVSFKPWPACRNAHPFITATLDIVKGNGIKPEDTEAILLAGGSFAQSLCEPLEERRRPKASIDAKVSLPFIIGAALARGKVVLSDFTPAGLNDPAALEMAQKVTFRFEERFNTSGIEPALVEIKTKDGGTYSKEVEFAYGHPQNPMTLDDLIAKFRDCASYSVRPLANDAVDQVIQMVTNLEGVEDVGAVVRLLG